MVKDYQPRVKWINQSNRDFVFRGEPQAYITLGDDVALNDATIDMTAGFKCGDRVHFGHQVMVLTTSHPSEIKDGNKRRRVIDLAPIVIGDDAYIGSRAIILKGVVVGKGAYVGAGSVVTKDVPDGEVWAGVPARRIK